VSQVQIRSAELPASTEGYRVLRIAAPGGRLSDPKRTSVQATPAANNMRWPMSALVELDHP